LTMPATEAAADLTIQGWDVQEAREIRSLATAIDNTQATRRRSIAGQTIAIALSEKARFSAGMQSTFRALIVRHLLHALGFDEHRVFRWRLEHKLVHAALLNHYAPGSVPVTRGLGRFLFGLGHANVSAALDEAFPAGYLIKESLGHSSGERGVANRAAEVLSSLQPGGMREAPERMCDEQWIVQQRIPIDREYRVQSIEERVVPDLTFHRFGTGNIPGERDAPNAFVESVLRRMPDAVVGGSLLAWDVALTPDGRFVVIEVNFSGYHPVNGPGFQCSGYFQDVPWGASMIARLLRFVEAAEGISIDLRIDSDERSRERDFYAEVIRWREMFRNGEYE
jgi:hypothetical protein